MPNLPPPAPYHPRMLRSVIIVAGTVYVLAAIAALVAGDPHGTPATDASGGGPAAAAPATRPTVADTLEGRPVIGSTFNVVYLAEGDVLRMGFLAEIDRMHALGLNTLQVVTSAHQKNGRDGGPSVEIGVGRSANPEDLRLILLYAKAKGMRTVLMPQVNLTNPIGNEWRGKIAPPDWDAWWADYRRMMDHFIDIANDADVDVLTIGCELISTHGEEHEPRWRALIAHARDHFDGLLTYSTTWDSYYRVRFWDALDLIGVSGYWDMTRSAADASNPTDGELAEQWTKYRQQLFEFAEKVDRPILITELGYPSLSWALKDPWNYVVSGKPTPDHAAQARGYQAFLAAWGPLLRPAPHAETLPDPRFAGVVFYKWDMYTSLDQAENLGYGIRNKPAFDVLKAFLRGDAGEAP